MTAFALGILSAAEVRELRAAHDATLVHACDVYVPTRTRAPGAGNVDTYAGPPTATALPCRYDAAHPGPEERLVAGAVSAAPPGPAVAFAAGTVVPATARLHVTGTSGGVAFSRWLAVQGESEPAMVEVGRVVRVAPAAAVGG